MSMKKRSRVIDIQKNNQIENSFMGVSETDVPACFNKPTCSPAINKQQPPLGKSHLTLGDILVRVLQKLRTSWITTVMTSGTATVAQLYRMVQLINWGKIVDVMMLLGTKNESRSSDSEESQ